MTNSPLGFTGYPSSTTSSSYSTQRSAQVVQENDDGSRVTINAKLSTTYSYSETRYTPGFDASQNAQLTYRVPENPASGEQAASQTPTRQTGATDAVSASSERNAGANTILAFIELRLTTDVSDGASQEELQSRLQAGFDGFMQGFNEALEQLKAMGLYEGDVKAAVDQTFNQVISGFAEMADKFGLENPAGGVDVMPEQTATERVPGTTQASIVARPADAFNDFVSQVKENVEVTNLKTLLQPAQDFYTQFDKEESESRLYRFNLQTADGDTVSIQSYADRGYRFQSDGNEQRLDVAGMESFQFSVNGELDDEEMRAISDLLAQINDIAEVFFAGDVEQAFEKALEIGFDSEEIARFSLNLTRVEYTRIEKTYGAVAQPESERMNLTPEESPLVAHVSDNKVAKLAEFVRQLENFRENSEPFELKGRQLEDFARFASHPRFGDHPNFDRFPAFVAHMEQALANP